MMKRLFGNNTLYVEISKKYIKLCTINKKKYIQNYICIALLDNVIKDNKIVSFDYFEMILREYISKSTYIFNKVILIINVEAILRVAKFPNINEKDLKASVSYSLKEHLLVDLSQYTTDYKILSYDKDNLEVLLVGVKTDIIQSYLKVFENLNITVSIIDLYQNFISSYLCSKNIGTFIVGISTKDKILIQFIEEGKFNYIKDIDNTDIARFFSRHTDLHGKINIKKAYLLSDTDKELIDFLVNKEVEIIYLDSIFDLSKDKELNIKEFWDIRRGI